MNIDASYPMSDLLPLLIKAEILAFSSVYDLPVPKNLKKEEIVQQLIIDHESLPMGEYLAEMFHIYEPLKLEFLLLYRLLFFGNFHQDLTEFVLTDLGVVRYEGYPLDRQTRPFHDRGVIDMLLLLHSTSEVLTENLPDMTTEKLLETIEILGTPANHPVVERRYGRICNTIGRQLERLGSGDDAIRAYELTGYPPSRERRARLYHKTGRSAEAAELVNYIIADPMDEEELDFATFFKPKIGGIRQSRNRVTDEYDSQVIEITEPPDQAVETYVLNMFAEAGVSGYFTENSLWCGLFGIVFWDIIFSPITGAFFNPYQRGPADLSEPGFRRRRADMIQEKLRHMEEISEYRFRRELKRFYRRKFGIANALVNWKALPRDLFDAAVSFIPKNHLVALFSRMCSDISANTSGFPDLVLFPRKYAPFSRAKHGCREILRERDLDLPYLLVEVKGPGDQLQKNQKRWMRQFQSADIPHRVVWLSLKTLA